MKAYLINPWTKTIEEVHDNFTEDYRLLYKYLTEPDKNPVDTFTSARLSNTGDTVWVDDEGMLKPDIPCFTFRMTQVPLAGRGLVTGVNEVGDTVQPSSTITLDWLNREVVWLGLVSTGEFGPNSESTIDHPTFGKVSEIRFGLPILKRCDHASR